MEAFWQEALRQVPALAVLSLVLLFIVSWFLRSLKQLSTDGRETINRFLEFMDDRDSRQGKRDQEHAESLKELGNNCHGFQREMANKVGSALDRNTEAFGRADAMADELRDFRRENRLDMQLLRHALRNLANEAGLSLMEMRLTQDAEDQSHGDGAARPVEGGS